MDGTVFALVFFKVDVTKKDDLYRVSNATKVVCQLHTLSYLIIPNVGFEL